MAATAAVPVSVAGPGPGTSAAAAGARPRPGPTPATTPSSATPMTCCQKYKYDSYLLLKVNIHQSHCKVCVTGRAS